MITTGAAGVGCLSALAFEPLYSFLRQKASHSAVQKCTVLEDIARDEEDIARDEKKKKDEEWLKVKQKLSLNLLMGLEDGSLREVLCAVGEAQVKTKMQSQLLAGLQSWSLWGALDAVAWKQQIQDKVHVDLMKASEHVALKASEHVALHASKKNWSSRSRNNSWKSDTVETFTHRCRPHTARPTFPSLPLQQTEPSPKSRVGWHSTPNSPKRRLGDFLKSESSPGASSVSTFEPAPDEAARSNSTSADTDTSDDEVSDEDPSSPALSQNPLVESCACTNKGDAKPTGFDLQLHPLINRLQLQDAGLGDALVTPRSDRRNPDAMPTPRQAAAMLAQEAVAMLSAKALSPRAIPLPTKLTARAAAEYPVIPSNDRVPPFPKELSASARDSQRKRSRDGVPSLPIKVSPRDSTRQVFARGLSQVQTWTCADLATDTEQADAALIWHSRALIWHSQASPVAMDQKHLNLQLGRLQCDTFCIASPRFATNATSSQPSQSPQSHRNLFDVQDHVFHVNEECSGSTSDHEEPNVCHHMDFEEPAIKERSITTQLDCKVASRSDQKLTMQQRMAQRKLIVDAQCSLEAHNDDFYNPPSKESTIHLRQSSFQTVNEDAEIFRMDDDGSDSHDVIEPNVTSGLDFFNTDEEPDDEEPDEEPNDPATPTFDNNESMASFIQSDMDDDDSAVSFGRSPKPTQTLSPRRSQPQVMPWAKFGKTQGMKFGSPDTEEISLRSPVMAG